MQPASGIEDERNLAPLPPAIDRTVSIMRSRSTVALMAPMS